MQARGPPVSIRNLRYDITFVCKINKTVKARHPPPPPPPPPNVLLPIGRRSVRTICVFINKNHFQKWRLPAQDSGADLCSSPLLYRAPSERCSLSARADSQPVRGRPTSAQLTNRSGPPAAADCGRSRSRPPTSATSV